MLHKQESSDDIIPLTNVRKQYQKKLNILDTFSIVLMVLAKGLVIV